MDISGLVNELSALLSEEKQLRAQMAKLRTRRQTVEQGIKAFLAETDDPGLKYRDLVLTVQDKEVRIYKNKTTKIDDAKNVLKRHGVPNADSIVGSVIAAMRGDTRTEQKLVVKKNKT